MKSVMKRLLWALALLAALYCAAAAEPADGYPVTLFYPTADEPNLLPVESGLLIGTGQSAAECAVLRLIDTSDEDLVIRPCPAGTRLLGIQQSEGAVVVDLSLDARNAQSRNALFLMRECVARTLFSLPGVECVDVLIAGRALPLSGAPAGCVTDADTAGRYALFMDPGAERGQSTAMLYVPDPEGRYIVPSPVRLQSGDDALSALIEAGNGAPLWTDWEVTALADGRQVARITMDPEAGMSDDEAKLRMAALTCTLTGYIPGLDGVLFEKDGAPVTLIGASDDAVMTRSSCRAYLADVVCVYVPDGDGALRPYRAAMPSGDARVPYRVLSLLFDKSLLGAYGFDARLPEDVLSDALLGVSVDGDVATISLSPRFVSACQALSPDQERLLVYAWVNTLTRIPPITGVRFAVSTEPIEALSGFVSMKNPLVRAPGMIRAASE